MTNLDGIHAKVRRAEQHIKEITDDMDKRCTEVKQSIVREVCEDSSKQIWTYRGETPNIPIEWSVILGEILYNLRSSLDHLVWQLVLANGQTPGGHNTFPITTDDGKWQKTKGTSLKGVSKRYEAMIGYLQPFTGGIDLPFSVSMLRVLNGLGNTEKHRHLILAAVASSGIEPLDHPDRDDASAKPPRSGSFATGRIESGKVLLQLKNADTEIEPSFKVDVCFGDIGQAWARGRPVQFTLDKCLRTVKGCVDFLTTPMGDGFVAVPQNP